jgi:hypothetical protein
MVAEAARSQRSIGGWGRFNGAFSRVGGRDKIRGCVQAGRSHHLRLRCFVDVAWGVFAKVVALALAEESSWWGSRLPSESEIQSWQGSPRTRSPPARFWSSLFTSLLFLSGMHFDSFEFDSNFSELWLKHI